MALRLGVCDDVVELDDVEEAEVGAGVDRFEGEDVGSVNSRG